jgi:predicted ATPase
MMAATANTSNDPPPDVWIRLADKGLEKTDRFFPFINAIQTPCVLRGRRVKQYREDELEPKKSFAKYVMQMKLASLGLWI